MATNMPTKLKVTNLGIGINDDTREALNMSTAQYLVVGEKNVTDGNGVNKKTFSLFSDVYGVTVNTNALETDSLIRDRYALYVSGNVFVDGNITTTDGKIYPGSNVGGSNTGGYAGDLFWSSTTDNNAIFTVVMLY